MSFYDVKYDKNWKYHIASPSGNGFGVQNTSSSERRCNCPNKYGPATSTGAYRGSNEFNAVCDSNPVEDTRGGYLNWLDNNTCPKGWGKNTARYRNDYYQVGCSQGYIADNSGDPIYSTVTKYRDAYHNYISTRVAKA